MYVRRSNEPKAFQYHDIWVDGHAACACTFATQRLSKLLMDGIPITTFSWTQLRDTQDKMLLSVHGIAVYCPYIYIYIYTQGSIMCTASAVSGTL